MRYEKQTKRQLMDVKETNDKWRQQGNMLQYVLFLRQFPRRHVANQNKMTNNDC